AGSELPRQAPEVRRAATERIKEMIDLLERHGPAWGEAAGHDAALAQLSCIVGAMIVARAVDEPALAQAVRRAARASVTGKRR
ncbi:MAG TPA: TetR/AcrR family transcriptional regulator, partial [Caldimonas sp.]